MEEEEEQARAAAAMLRDFGVLRKRAAVVRETAERYTTASFWDRTRFALEQVRFLQGLYDRERELNAKCALVRAALLAIPEEDRRLLVACYVKKRGVRALAASMPYSARTLYRRRQKALVRFARAAESVRERGYSSSKLSLS